MVSSHLENKINFMKLQQKAGTHPDIITDPPDIELIDQLLFRNLSSFQQSFQLICSLFTLHRTVEVVFTIH